MSMWEPFTEHARRAIVLAQEFASDRGNNSIGGPHLFVGIVEAGGDAAEELSLHGISSSKVREAAESIVEPEKRSKSKEMVFDPEAKRVIDLAFAEARDLNHSYIGTEHLMLGYLRECKLRSDLLARLEIDPETFQSRILERAKSAPPRRPPPRRIMSASLEELFDRFGGTNTRPEELWSRLGAATDQKDVTSALCYAFCIALRSGWTSRFAAEQIEEFLEKHSE